MRVKVKNTISDLEKYFISNDKRQILKPYRYFDVYERHLNRYRGHSPVIMEIGVSQGGSLQMWKEYFGEGAKIYGIDVNPECKNLEEDDIKIFIGSQSDKNFLKKLIDIVPPIDVLIDDGSHISKHQIISFKELFEHIKDNGVYCCEDIGTSYSLRYGGGYKRIGTFIEYSKKIIDYLNTSASEQKRLKPNLYTTSINSIHYYWGMILIEKLKRQEKQIPNKTGHLSFKNKIVKRNILSKIYHFFIQSVLKITNSILRFFRLPGFCSRKFLNL